MMIQPPVSCPGRIARWFSLDGEEGKWSVLLVPFVSEVKCARLLRLHGCGEYFEFGGMVMLGAYHRGFIITG